MDTSVPVLSIHLETGVDDNEGAAAFAKLVYSFVFHVMKAKFS
jgi:hypothetical protein